MFNGFELIIIGFLLFLISNISSVYGSRKKFQEEDQPIEHFENEVKFAREKFENEVKFAREKFEKEAHFSAKKINQLLDSTQLIFETVYKETSRLPRDYLSSSDLFYLNRRLIDDLTSKRNIEAGLAQERYEEEVERAKKRYEEEVERAKKRYEEDIQCAQERYINERLENEARLEKNRQLGLNHGFFHSLTVEKLCSLITAITGLISCIAGLIMLFRN